jgi:hypothetical protein
MKKFLVVALVMAAVCFSTAAYAIDVTINGEVDLRTRLLENTTNPSGQSVQPNSHRDDDNNAYQQSRFLVEVNVKGDGVKGKLALWNDHDTWMDRGQVDASSSNRGLFGTIATAVIREAWIDFMVPGTPIGVKVGRTLGQIGQGWFLRSNTGGMDLYNVYANIGKVATIALQDVVMAEGFAQGATSAQQFAATTKTRDDVDLYSLIATIKPADAVTVGLDVSYLKDNNGVILTRPGVGGGAWLWNVGLNWNVKAGPATIKGEIDVQNGHSQNNTTGGREFDGYQGILQASIPIGIVTINVGAALGSGNAVGNNDNTHQVVTMLDSGQHYTLIYEYFLKGASGAVNNGFANTTALFGGVMVRPIKSLEIGFDTYWLQATERVALTGGNRTSNDLGIETDVKLNWYIYPNLTWGWQFAWFATGAAYRQAPAPLANNSGGGAMSDAYAIQGILSLKF